MIVVCYSIAARLPGINQLGLVPAPFDPDAGGHGQLRNIRGARLRRNKSSQRADGARTFWPRCSRAGSAPNQSGPVCECRSRPNGSSLEQSRSKNGEPIKKSCHILGDWY